MNFIGVPLLLLAPPPPPPLEPPLLRLEVPRLLALRAVEPLLTPLNALPEEERLADGLGLDWKVLVEGAGRLAVGDAAGRLPVAVPVEGRAPTFPVEGRVPTAPVEGCAPTFPVEGRVPTAPVEGRAPAAPSMAGCQRCPWKVVPQRLR